MKKTSLTAAFCFAAYTNYAQTTLTSATKTETHSTYKEQEKETELTSFKGLALDDSSNLQMINDQDDITASLSGKSLTNGMFIIDASTNTKQIIQVYDTDGNMKVDQTISGKTILDVGNLNKGIYKIIVKNDNGTIKNKIVVLVR